jgi:hypothetical protein
MTARRHHFIPQFYLKGFTVDRKKKRQLAVFDGKDRKAFIAAIDNVALERDFNRVEVEGLEPDAFENAVAAFEAEIAPALDRIIATQSNESEDDRITLVNLIGALALRNPRLRETIREFVVYAGERSIRSTHCAGAGCADGQPGSYSQNHPPRKGNL